MADRKKVVRAVETCFDSWIDKHRNMGLDLHEVERMKRDALALLKEQVQEQIVHCKDCRYGLYTGTEYHCDKHSGHENRLGEDQYYKEWHNGNWFCADGERR